MNITGSCLNLIDQSYFYHPGHHDFFSKRQLGYLKHFLDEKLAYFQPHPSKPVQLLKPFGDLVDLKNLDFEAFAWPT